MIFKEGKIASGAAMKESIEIKNATVNNLKSISVSFPINTFTCVTGVSGGGKSSLVYDTIYAESQRNFLESMSGNMYGQKLMDKPAVESITNLRPALNVSQIYYNSNPRSTVGTVTDISYYLRTIFALVSNYEKHTKLTEQSFSPNNPTACCPYCRGLGEEYVISEDCVVPDVTKTLAKGAIKYYAGKETSLAYRTLEAVCNRYKIDINKKFSDLTEREKKILLYRTEDEIFDLKFKTPKGRYKHKEVHSKGAIIELQEQSLNLNQSSVFAAISKYLVKQPCLHCKGSKLNENALIPKVGGKNIFEVESLKIDDLQEWCKVARDHYNKSCLEKQINQLTIQICKKLEKLIQLKVGYLSLQRTIPSLSGGEVQRIRLATQLTCSLRGLLYILDEPCKGLHARDIEAIISATKQLVQEKNTVIAIEHNRQYISAAEKVIELGPVGGPKGGYIVSDDKLKKNLKYQVQFKRPQKFEKFLQFKGITYHNLRNQAVEFPINAITCITGVSGSGKSSLVDVISASLTSKKMYCCQKITGRDLIKHIERVNQKPIGKTSRSTVVSYLGIYDEIRNLFAATDYAMEHDLTASNFSMNVKGGRCEECQGTGYKKIELTYLPDSYIICPVCEGRRFKDTVLEVKYKGLTIDDVLDTAVSEIVDVFSDSLAIYEKLQCMIEIGLGYLKLGQMSMSLSGGEAQRIKLTKALGSNYSSRCLYILDEPTSGLSEKDIEKIEKILRKLKNRGNTILIIEHNPEFVMRNAEYLVDFGCFGGERGGQIIAQGSVEDVFKDKNSSWNYLL